MKKYAKYLISIFVILLSLSFLASCVLGTDGPVNTENTNISNGTSSPDVTTLPDNTENTNITSSDVTSEAETEITSNENEGLTEAPDIKMYDISGKAVKLSDFFGKPIVLNFWASWCPPCVNELPAFAEVYREYKDEVVFLFVNCMDGATETIRTVQNFISANNYNDLPIYLDKTNERYTKYGVEAIPFTFFINEDGYIVNSINSSISKDRLLTEIAKIYTPEK